MKVWRGVHGHNHPFDTAKDSWPIAELQRETQCQQIWNFASLAITCILFPRVQCLSFYVFTVQYRYCQPVAATVPVSSRLQPGVGPSYCTVLIWQRLDLYHKHKTLNHIYLTKLPSFERLLYLRNIPNRFQQEEDHHTCA